MKPGMRRFSLAGLILAGIAFATSIIAGSIKIFQLLGLLTLKNQENVNLTLEISVGVVIFGLALYALMAPEKVREFLTGRQVRYGSNSLVMSLAFIGILVVVNFLVYQKPQQWDVTESKEHTLAPETLGILSKIPEKVNATAFYSSQMSSEQAGKLLTDFKTNSNGKLEYQFIDPDLNPNAAIEAGITGDGKILLQMGDRKEIAAYADEQELTQALIRLIYPQERVVYFLTGHGERDSQDGSEESITKVSQTLESKNYTVKILNLKAVNQVPEDAKVVIIAGPKKQVSTEEITLLEAYLEKGGALVVMEDPIALTDFGDQADPLAKDLEEKWGITLKNDFIIDPNGNPPIIAIGDPGMYGSHTITQKLSGLFTLFPRARSLSIKGEPTDINRTTLVQTTDIAWGETDIASIGQDVSYEEGVDNPGPLFLAIAAEDSVKKSRLVVFGNSEFAADVNFNAYGNGDLLINTIDWAAEQENLINLTPKEPITRSFNPLNQIQLIAVIVGSICLMPGVALAGGIVSWIARRKRG